MFRKILALLAFCGAAALVCGAESPKSFPDIFPKRQINDSYRTIELPAGTDTGKLALFELDGGKLTDRVVPFRILKGASGEVILKFKGPGLTHGSGAGVVWKDGKAKLTGTRNAVPVPEDFGCRLLFRKGGVIDNTIPAGPAELIYNGDFSIPHKKNPDIPDGFFSVFSGARDPAKKRYTFLKPGLRIVRHAPGGDFFPICLRLERGVTYTFSIHGSCTNPSGRWIVMGFEFYNRQGKRLPNGTTVYLFHSRRGALPLKTLSKTFMAPAEAVSATICLRVYATDQVMTIKNISLKADPFRAEKLSETELLRKELVSSYVPGLSLTENLSHAVVTPHWDMYKNPARKFPKLLYLTGNTGSFISSRIHRRHIIELAQRAKLEFTYLPLFRKIASSRNSWHFNWADTLEPYTLAKLREITKVPEAVMLNQVDFTYIPAVTRAQLLSWQKQGAPMIFFNCKNIPADLLGKAEALPPHLLATLPRMRELRPEQIRENLRFFRQGKTPIFTIDTGDFTLWNVRYLPFVPAEFSYEMVPNFHGADFPYWEYCYMLHLKLLRYAAAAEGKVIARKAERTILEVDSAEPCAVTVRTVARDYYGRLLGEAQKKYTLRKGKNQLVLPLPGKPLPGGTSILNFRIFDAQNRELDCGASRVDTPALPLKIAMAAPQLVFARRDPVNFTLESVPGALFSCEIADTEGRVVWRGGGKGTKYSVPLRFPYTKLYNLFVKAELGGKTALLKQEFSLESAPIDPYETAAVIWPGASQFFPGLRKMGFNMSYTNFTNAGVKYGMLRSLATLGMEAVSCGSGLVLNRTMQKYKEDIASDPVRNPCFSDPGRAAKVEAELLRIAKDYRFHYFGLRHYILADEAYLGGTVCFSPHCLAEFRKELKTRYKDLAELNKSWGTSYASWDQAVPVQLKELKDPDRLARYVEHKLFMNKVFARNWVGTVGAVLNREVPGSISGLSGTGNPGYSYDWVQMMKYNPLLIYYGGPQGNAVRDFAPRHGRRGKFQGYSRGFLRNEVVAKGKVWQDVFAGANLICKFPCESLLGDLTVTPNMRFFAEAVKEIRSGFGARMLRGEDVGRDIGVLYSQMSVLCAFSNQFGQQNVRNTHSSWHALLTDLGLKSRMISYEDLEKNVPKFKIVVLPATFSLSKNQLANLQKYVEQGGIVVADCGPGWYDDHGNRLTDGSVEKFFGIDRSAARLYPSNAPRYKTLPVGETGLKLAGGKAALTVGGEPIMITRSCGKGKTLLLNLGIGGYFTVTLGGAGGEEEIAKGGAGLTCQALRELTSPVFCSICRPPFEVKGITGPTIFLHKDGINFYAGILPPVKDVPSLSDLKRETVRVKFPVKGHLYEMRSGRYLGFGDSCTLKVRSGDPALLSILRDKVTGVKIGPPAEWKRGESRKVTVKIAGGSGNHVLRIEVRRPDGTLPLNYFWNAYVPAEKSAFDFQFARNDVPGKWEFRVRDIDSGVTGSTFVELK